MAKTIDITAKMVITDDASNGGQPPITVLKRSVIANTALAAGDTFSQEVIPGTILQSVDLVAGQAMTADEAVLFETLFEGRRCLGGFIMEKE